jgi:transcription antitermination factor NusA-like protein
MVISIGFFLQTLGLFAAEVPVEVDDEANFFEKKKEKKERKFQKKIDAEIAVDAEKDRAKAAKKYAKLQIQKAIKTEQRAAVEEEKKQMQEDLPEVEAAGKKKKKKKKKPTKADAEPVAASPVKPTEQPDAQGWEVKKDEKKEAWVAKKAKTGPGGPSVEDEMLLNPRHYPVILGEGGKTLARLEEAFGVKLDLPRKNSSEEKIKITGSESAIAFAKQAINELADKKYSKTLDGNLDDAIVEVSAKDLGTLIGPGGANIRAIQLKTNTKIQLPDKDSRGDGPSKVTVVGDAQDVADAVHAIKQLAEKGYSSLTHENYVEVTMGFPAAMIGILKGPGGEQIKRIQKTTGTRVNVQDPVDNVPLVTLTIVGPSPGVDAARNAIGVIQTDYNSRSLDLPLHLVQALKGQGFANINRLQKQTSTRIEVLDHLWDPNRRTVNISGFTKDIGAVEEEIQSLVASHSNWRVDFPAARIGDLFGKKGEKIKELQTSTKTRINVAEHDWDDLVKEITVMGPKEGVDRARLEIEALGRPPSPGQPPRALEPKNGETAPVASA